MRVAGLLDGEPLAPSLCLSLLSYLREAYPELLDKRYEIDKEELERACEAHEEGLMMLSDSRALAYMDLIAKKRGTIKRGAQPDYERCAALIIDDFRSQAFPLLLRAFLWRQ